MNQPHGDAAIAFCGIPVRTTLFIRST